MAFSPGLVLSDLSDYLAPSQICIKPVEQVEDPRGFEEGAEHGGAAATEIRMDEGTQEYFEVERAATGGGRGTGVAPREQKLKKAQITLNDCLACSGCITSAESVLVSMQSHEEVRSVLASHPELVPVLSIAPQPIASLAALHGLPPPSVLAGLRRFFKRALGFRLVLDTTMARELSLCEGRREFLDRFSSASSAVAAGGPLPLLSSSCPGWICYAEKTHGELLPFISRVKSPQQVQGSLVKGNIAGALGVAPGRVYHVALMMCYDKKLEASRPDFLVPGKKEGEVAAREVDCVLTAGEVQKMMDEEGWDLRRASEEEAQAERTRGANGEDEEARLLPDSLPPRGSSSGGALHNILQAVISSLPPPDLARAVLAVEPRRGQDYVDYTLSLVGSSMPLFKGAQCYGFRNLQNVVRKVGRERGVVVTRGAAGTTVGGPAGGRPGGKSAAALAAAARRAARKHRADGGAGAALSSRASTPASAAVDAPATEDRPYDYIEVMACPSGCVNGGGQVPPPKGASASLGDGRGPGAIEAGGEMKMVNGGDGPVWSPKDWVAKVERAYWSTCVAPLIPEGADRLHPSIRPYALPPSEWEVKAEEILNGMGEGERKLVMRTGYRAVASEEVNGLAVKW